MSNLIVADSEYISLQKEYLTLGEKIEDRVSAYIRILNDICENSVTSGTVYNNLMSYKGECEGLREQISEIANLLSRNMENYINNIDNKDQYIY